MSQTILQNVVVRLIINFTVIIIFINLFQNCDNSVSPDENDLIIEPPKFCEDTTYFPLNADGLLPLNVGNYWEYKLQTFIYGGEADTTIFTNYTVQQIKEKHYSLYDC